MKSFIKPTKHRKNSRVGQGCPHGQFWDVKGGNGLLGACYSCPKHYHRTATAVDHKHACARSINEKLHHAKFQHKFPCKPGQFNDPRKGGECWSCPSGYDRNITPVTSRSACAANIAHICDSGMVLAQGTTCYKKGHCGKKGQRPCLITERIPSCNKGLAEDFIANKCINPRMAACLTGVRSLRFKLLAAKGLSAAEHEVLKLVHKAEEKLINSVPGLKKVMHAADSAQGKLLRDAKKLVAKDIDKLTHGVDRTFKAYEHVLKAMEHKFAKNSKKLVKMISSDSFCTMSNRERHKRFAELTGFDAKKIKKADAGSNSLTKFAGSLLAKPAHASNNSDPTYVMLGLNITHLKDHIDLGPAIALGWFPDDPHYPVDVWLGAVFSATSESRNRGWWPTPFVKLLPAESIQKEWNDAVKRSVEHVGFMQTVFLQGTVNFGKKRTFSMPRLTSRTSERRGTGSITLAISGLLDFGNPKHPFTCCGISGFPFVAQKGGTQEGRRESSRGTFAIGLNTPVRVTKR